VVVVAVVVGVVLRVEPPRESRALFRAGASIGRPLLKEELSISAPTSKLVAEEEELEETSELDP
jgi:hypothetical protein